MLVDPFPGDFVRRFIALTIGVVGLVSRSAEAQVCSGFGSFANGIVGIGANVYGAPGVTGAGASINVGTPGGIFGGAQVGLQDVNISSNSNSDFLVSSMRMGAYVGYEIPLAKTDRISICPSVGVGHRFGPNYAIGNANVRQTANDYAGEIAFGGAIKLGAKADLVPSVAIGYSGWTYKSMIVGGESATGSAAALDATFSVGVVIANRFAIRPFVAISAQENSDPTIGLSFHVQLGQKR